MTQEAEQAVRRAQEACERITPDIEPWDPVWVDERKSQKRERSTNDKLRRRLGIALRQLAEAKANEERWCARIKALEERLARVADIARGAP